MSYSEKQKLYADYMLKRIGITNPNDIEIYLSHLEKLYGRMVSYPNRGYYGGYSWRYSAGDCIDLLTQEIDLKKSIKDIKFVEPPKLIQATDLANFEYCPVSFAIRNTFLIEHPSGEEFTETGKMLHETLLAARVKWYEDPENDFSSNDLNVRMTSQSRLVFAGHQDGSRKFVNGNWVGVPDYIFQDSNNNYFVVEEKFQKKRDPQKISFSEKMDDIYGGSSIDEEADKERLDWEKHKGYFFSNHIVQLASYIKNIKEYPISYGYLIYWYYDFDGDQPYIHKAVAKKIILDTETEELYLRAIKGVEQIKTIKTSAFSIDKLNMRKCAGCIVNKYCGHKTRRCTTLSFPYDPKFLSLYFATFPEELKKAL